MIPRSPVDAWLAGKLGTTLEELNQEMLEKYQLKEIRKLLYYLKEHSDFYSRQLKDCDPETILTMEDFRTLPLSGEADLAGWEWRFQCIQAGQVSRIVTVPTTGTMGSRKRIAFSKKDLACTRGFAPAGFAVMCDPGDKVAVMMSGGSEGSIGDSVTQGLVAMGVSAAVYGVIQDLSDAARFLLDYQPDVIVGIPVQMTVLERYMRDRFPFQLKSVLLSADDVPEALCRRLRTTWGCNTFRHYGMTELCMFGAVECQGASGYHMRSADHLFEILDPDEDGFGEIAITTFHHEAMPLLRYRTGDVGCMLTDRCQCGSSLYRLGKIKGRMHNSVAYPEGRIFLRDISEIVFADAVTVDFECAAGWDGICVKVKVLPDDTADVHTIKERIQNLPGMHKRNVLVTQEAVEGLPDACKGKKRMIINEDTIFDSIDLSCLP